MLAPVLLAAALAAPPETSQAIAAPPQVTLPHTERRELTSAAGVRHDVRVSLPRSFASEPARRYPLLVVLDPDYAFPLAHAMVDHLSDRGRLPELVVVGVGYSGSTTMHDYRMHRSRDYTPWPSARGGYGQPYDGATGGAPAFLAFLRDVLLPLLEREYRVGSDRVLVGHSYGGLFSLWALSEAPGLFTGHVVVSPSIWFEDRKVLGPAGLARLTREAAGRTRAYLAVGDREGSEEREMQGDLERAEKVLAARGVPRDRLRRDVLAGQSHDSVFPVALTNALGWLWRDAPGVRP
ncbi:MAG: alpha/beta hydrolase-fold protein [Anaeromyxobacter sp.]